jgi:hypothetical protein
VGDDGKAQHTLDDRRPAAICQPKATAVGSNACPWGVRRVRSATAPRCLPALPVAGSVHGSFEGPLPTIRSIGEERMSDAPRRCGRAAADAPGTDVKADGNARSFCSTFDDRAADRRWLRLPLPASSSVNGRSDGVVFAIDAVTIPLRDSTSRVPPAGCGAKWRPHGDAATSCV